MTQWLRDHIQYYKYHRKINQNLSYNLKDKYKAKFTLNRNYKVK